MKRFLQHHVLALVVAGAVLLPFTAQAQSSFAERVRSGATAAGQASGVAQTVPLTTLIGAIINTLLSLVGVVLIVLVVYAGFLWMTAGGNADQVKKARAMIINAVVGIVIVFASYSIADFVLNRLAETTGSSGTVQNTAPTP